LYLAASCGITAFERGAFHAWKQTDMPGVSDAMLSGAEHVFALFLI